MEPAPELRQRMLAIYEVLVGRPGLTDFVLDEHGVHGIGSDPAEWWPGERLGEILTAQGTALRGAAIIGCDPQAWAEDDVGWVYDRFTYRSPDGTETPFRISATFVRRGAEWKLVLWHDSVPIPNSEAIGLTIPT